MPFDELNTLQEVIGTIFSMPSEARKDYEDFLHDEFLDLLILSYLYGNEAANTMLFGEEAGRAGTARTAGTTATEAETPLREAPFSIPPTREELTESVSRTIAGKNWEERLKEYLESDTATAEDVFRVADTDSHRIYNEAIFTVGEKADAASKGSGNAEGVILKTWETMRDDRVRESHDYLEGTTIPFDEYFYTYTGAAALRPGDFNDPAEDINCRCRIRLSRA